MKMSTRESLPVVSMIAIEFSKIGVGTLSKAAFRSGLSQYVYIVYYDVLGTLILLPWLASRWISGKRLPITFSLLCRFFCFSLIGTCLFPICHCTGLKYSSVTVGAAIGNLSPIFTILLAVIFRMEKLDLRMFSDQIKTMGIFVAVLGALVVTLYQGPALLTTQGSSDTAYILLSKQPNNWLYGFIFLSLGTLLKSVKTVFQANTVKSYPDEVAITFFYTLFGAIQVAAASFFMVEDRSSWQLHNKIEIIAMLYSAFMFSLFIATVTSWCLHKKGPIYVSMFSPLGVAIAAVAGFVFLDDSIYLGSVIGSVAIIVGFYAIMWGQAKKKSAMVCCLESASDQVTPLLQTSHN